MRLDYFMFFHKLDIDWERIFAIYEEKQIRINVEDRHERQHPEWKPARIC